MTVTGSRLHQEYWIPADRLDDFNAVIVGVIDVIAEYQRGERVPDAT
jgi:hypothetical protein